MYLQAESNCCILGDLSSLDSDGKPNRTRLTRGAPGPVVTNSKSSGVATVGIGRSGIIGIAHPRTIGPCVAFSNCIKPL